MGILGSTASFIAKGVVKTVSAPIISDALDASIKAVDKASSALEKSIEKREEKKKSQVLSGNPTMNRLIICVEKNKSKTSGYNILNRDEILMYSVHCKKNRTLYFYNSLGQEIAVVKEKKITIRNPLFHEREPKDFIVEINGSKVGIVKSKASTKKEKYKADFVPWVVIGNIIGKNFIITENERHIAEVSPKYSIGNAYAVDYTDSENEFLVLVFTIIADYASEEI